MNVLDMMEAGVEAQMSSHQYGSIQDAVEAFDRGVNMAVMIADDSAFSIIRSSMDYMQTNGEFARVQQMAMVLGATACMHDHMQGISGQMSERFQWTLGDNNTDDIVSKHDHSDGATHEDEEDFEWVNGKKVKKKRK